jgi:hypothetical protein
MGRSASTLPEAIIRRLALIRYLYNVAVQQSGQPEPFGLVSILAFHDCIELFLQLASEQLNVSKQGRNFVDYPKVLQSKMGRELEAVESLSRLNKSRVDFKHYGILPSRLDIEGFRGNTSNFFEANTPMIFGIEFHSISMGELIHNQELCKLIKKAESYFAKGSYRKAIKTSDAALDKATTDYIFGKAGVLTRYWGAKALQKILFRAEYVRPFRGQSRKLAEDLTEAIVEVGRIATSMQFLDTYKGAFLRHRATMNGLKQLSGEELRNAASSSLDFVTELLLKWQTEGILE